MIEILANNPLLLLAVVAAIGYPLGHIKIGGSSLGIAAVLFVGLAIGALDPRLRLPEIIYQLGLVLFVYTVGLSGGPSFFAALQRKGGIYNSLTVGMLLLAALLTILFYNLLNLKPALAVGMFVGSITNTAALAAALEKVKEIAPPALLEQLLSEPTVGYSITYPMGVIGMILAVYFLQRLWKIDYAKEAAQMREPEAVNLQLRTQTLKLSNPEVDGKTIQQVLNSRDADIVFSRVKHDGKVAVATGQTRLAVGDLVCVVGSTEELEKARPYLGESSPENIQLDRSELDYRRIFVSNPKVAGRRLRDLHLSEQFGALATRVRRGDREFLPHGNTVLELGDRVRVVAPRDRMDNVSQFFGDSYRALSEIDILTFNLGLALGLLIGLISIPLPGGLSFKLGLAGGPLIVALILGTIERTGPFVWSLPYNANLTLRQCGLVLFLAGVGTRAGYPFVSTLTQGGGVYIFLGGAVITITLAVLTLWIGYKLLKIPMGLLLGILAGIQTQPALLSYALEQTDNDLPNLGYATVYPVAIIGKILLAQVVLSLLL